MSNSRPFWSSSRSSSAVAKGDLRRLCVGIWFAPVAFWLPHFLPLDAAPVTAQPLGAALEREATGCFSGESSSPGEKQLPSHVGWSSVELPAVFKCRLWLAGARGVIRTKPSKQQLFILVLYSFVFWLWLLIEVLAWLWLHQTQHQICHWLYYEPCGV